VPQIPSRIAAPQASKRPISIRLKLHIGSLYVLKQSPNAGLGIAGGRHVLGTVARQHGELADKFGIVGDVRVEADEVFADLLAACELLAADVALVRLHLGVDAGAVPPQVVQVVCAVRTLLALVTLRLRQLSGTLGLSERKLAQWIHVAGRSCTNHESTTQRLINVTRDPTSVQYGCATL